MGKKRFGYFVLLLIVSMLTHSPYISITKDYPKKGIYREYFLDLFSGSSSLLKPAFLKMVVLR
jgi:hypothetical protein